MTTRVASLIADCSPGTIAAAKRAGWLTPIGRRGGNGPEVYYTEDVLRWMRGERPDSVTVLPAAPDMAMAYEGSES